MGKYCSWYVLTVPLPSGQGTLLDPPISYLRWLTGPLVIFVPVKWVRLKCVSTFLEMHNVILGGRLWSTFNVIKTLVQMFLKRRGLLGGEDMLVEFMVCYVCILQKRCWVFYWVFLALKKKDLL